MRPLVFVASVAIGGCAMQARLYDMESATVMPAAFTYSGSGKGTISFTLPNVGECVGEYVTGGGRVATWGRVYSNVGGPATMHLVAGTPLTQRGSAVAICPGGRSMECEYITSGLSSGTGYCSDNRGGRYRLMF